MEEKKIRIGISLGDINGISSEILIKALSDERIYKYAHIIIYGSESALNYAQKSVAEFKTKFHVIQKNENKTTFKTANVFDIGGPNVIITPGQANDFAGKLAIQFLNTALEDLKLNKIDVLVTAPLNKSTIKEKEVFTGHTEYIAKFFNASESMMLMVYENLRVGLVTNHLPLEDVKKNLNANLILRKLQIMQKSLKQDFGIDKPKIAVLSLNPHAGDNGLLGNEEKEIILPAITKAKENGILAWGVYAADGFFGNGLFTQFDGVLAMYHDQGLIPFKALSGSRGVNFTAGLSIVRTSPDHGTAYDIVGKDIAEYESILSAIYTAIDIYNTRSNYKFYSSNPMKRNQDPKRDESKK
jgi:4-hydroxythreonine-4-phosphate dehydrogenase